MELVYAFTDEYGAFGWKLDNPTVSTHFIITAVIVKESDVSEYEEKAEAIRSKYFQTGEIKSEGRGKPRKTIADITGCLAVARKLFRRVY